MSILMSQMRAWGEPMWAAASSHSLFRRMLSFRNSSSAAEIFARGTSIFTFQMRQPAAAIAEGKPVAVLHHPGEIEQFEAFLLGDHRRQRPFRASAFGPRRASTSRTLILEISAERPGDHADFRC